MNLFRKRKYEMIIKEIKGTKDPLLDQFFELEKIVYENDPIHVSNDRELYTQLSNNPEIEITSFLGFIDERPVIRASIIIHQGAREEGNLVAWIGFIEMLDIGHQYSTQILQKCVRVAKLKGIKRIIGPKINNSIQGLQMDKFHLPHTFNTPHNPRYYKNIFSKAGFRRKFSSYSFHYTRDSYKEVNSPDLDEYVVRTLNLGNLDGEIEIFNSIQNEAFSGKNNYVPRTIDEDRDMINSVLSFIDPEMILIAEYKKRVVGIIICLPDINQQLRGEKITRVRVISIAVSKEHRRKGIAQLMGVRLMHNLLSKTQYQLAEVSIILDYNLPPLLLAKKFNATAARKFNIYEMNAE